MAAKKPKKEKLPEPFWNELVSVYFDFCRSKFNENPSFDGSAPKDLKNIIQSLHKRAVDSNVEWDLAMAKQRLWKFLEFSFQDYWLRNNFLLSNINRQKDKIFFNIRSAILKTKTNG